MVLVKCSGCGETAEVPFLPVEGTLLDKICESDELKVNKCDFKEVEEGTDCELDSTFSCASDDIHEKCGKAFAECQCSFVRRLRCRYRGKTVHYYCHCHPLTDDCECWHCKN